MLNLSKRKKALYKILCVDDIEANIFVIQSLFESEMKEHSVLVATSGLEALEVLLKEDIDLILLDVMMPELDGFETAKIIKSNKKTKDIPIIFVTAKRTDDTIKNAFTFGVDYISKPYDDFELISRVKHHLKLVEFKRKLDEQIEFTQSILDSQKNIIFTCKNQKLISINQSFKDFFSVESIEEFMKSFGSVKDLFLEIDGYFSKSELKDDEEWLRKIYENSDKSYNVIMVDPSTFEQRAFNISVNRIKNSDSYVVSLSDVTQMAIESKRNELRATTDSLTKVFNRLKFGELFENDIKTAQELNANLTFAIFDIDFFKKVNDTYGHDVGDEVLKRFAKVIKNNIRDTDIFARWGGEEFVLSLLGAKKETAFRILDGLRVKVEETEFPKVGHITCSIGATALRKVDSAKEIFKRADEALYEAKESGRNRVCIYEQDECSTPAEEKK